MKAISALALFLVITSSAFSQNKPQELYDILSSLAIQKTDAANIIAWTKLPAQTTAIKWMDKSPVKAGTMMRRAGLAAALINGKKFICEDQIGGKKADCRWEIVFQGKPTGYDRISVSASNFPVNEAGSEIKMLFPQNVSSFKLVSRCIDGASYWRNLYEVNIPGKKTFWMTSTFESMSGTAAQYESSGVANNFYVDFYFNRKVAEDECAN